MNQTNNRIREECSVDYNLSPQITDDWKKKVKEDFLQFIDKNDIEVEMKSAVAGFFFSKIAELLKSQRAELVEKIKKISVFADSGDTLKSRIINLINQQNDL